MDVLLEVDAEALLEVDVDVLLEVDVEALLEVELDDLLDVEVEVDFLLEVDTEDGDKMGEILSSQYDELGLDSVGLAEEGLEGIGFCELVLALSLSLL